MRIAELSLIAFGPFEDEVLRFGEEPGLDLVYGPNEAGKSTALRAITGLFYGIPERTPDAHRHPTARLRIGARLSCASGELEVVRRKGRKGTLFDGGGVAIDEARLERMLAGVSQSMFLSMFGVDHVVRRTERATQRRLARVIAESRESSDIGHALMIPISRRAVK